jgi:hypothetical protein
MGGEVTPPGRFTDTPIRGAFASEDIGGFEAAPNIALAHPK